MRLLDDSRLLIIVIWACSDEMMSWVDRDFQWLDLSLRKGQSQARLKPYFVKISSPCDFLRMRTDKHPIGDSLDYDPIKSIIV